MKVLDFALDVIEFFFAIATAHLSARLFPECSFERTMLVFILWQLLLQRRKVVK